MTNSTEPLRGEKLLKTAINKIILNPETWDQSNWHSSCGTKHCLAGWCQILAGKPACKETARLDAIKAIGITDTEADYLFDSACSMSEMYNFALWFSSRSYDRSGFNCYGYNRAGYDRAGKPLPLFQVD